MRDLSRFLNLYQRFITIDKASQDQSFIFAFMICYLSRLSKGRHIEAFDLLLESGIIKLQKTELLSMI